jgi:hypothetical protein
MNNTHKKPGKKKGNGKGTGSDDLEMDRFHRSIEEKNASIECALANETAVTCTKLLSELNTRHDTLSSELREGTL